MGKMNDKTLATGAKRVIAGVSLAAVLFAGMPTVAYASVPVGNVIGDLQTTEDRTDVKKNDVCNLETRYNTGGILLSDVEKAICLSNLLNGYYFDVLDFTNTNVNELLNVDITGMYDGYTWNAAYGDVNQFCRDNMFNKPACDGYITLASKGVADEIRNAIISRVRASYEVNGNIVEGTPRVVINGEELYCLIKVNGCLRKVVIAGDNVLNVINTINGLDNIYYTAINNLSGKDVTNDGSFMYNGIDKYTGESVYLSLPDDGKKATIQAGIDLARELGNVECYQTGLDTTYSETLSTEEKDALRNMGYGKNTVRNARKEFMTLVKQVIVTLTK